MCSSTTHGARKLRYEMWKEKESETMNPCQWESDRRIIKFIYIKNKYILYVICVSDLRIGWTPNQ